MSSFTSTLQYHCLRAISANVGVESDDDGNVTSTITSNNRTSTQRIALPVNLPMNTKAMILQFLSKRGTLSDDEMEALASHSTRAVNFQHCKNISDRSLLALSTRAPNLQSIDLSLEPNCDASDKCFRESIHQDALISLFHGCTGLRKIVLARIPNTTDHVLEAIGNNCKSLETLDVACCDNVSDGGIENIVGLSLTALNLNGLTKLTDKGCVTIAQGAISQTIQRLQICKVQSVTDDGVIKIIDSCPQLHSLLFNGCRNVGPRSREALSPSKRGFVQWTVY